MSGYLELADGALMVVRDGLVLGRVAACDIVVDDTKASRRHARLIVAGGVVEIEDLGSSNGTLLNGKPIERRMLRDGDEVRIGKTSIVYREGALPGSRSKASSAAGGAASVFDDDDDLFGGDDDGGDDGGIGEPDVAPAPPRPEPAPEPKVEAPPPPPPIEPVSPPPAPSSQVVEFEDEVVEVEQAPPPRPEPRPAPRPEPLVDVRPKSSLREPVVEARSPAKPSPSAKGGDDVVASSQRILQFSKKQGGGGLLGDDMGQMSSGMRALLVVALLAAGVGVAWGVVHLMR